jgi:hypothetical protein
MGEASTARVLRPFSGGRRKLRGVVFDMDGTLVRHHQGYPSGTVPQMVPQRLERTWQAEGVGLTRADVVGGGGRDA